MGTTALAVHCLAATTVLDMSTTDKVIQVAKT